MSELETEDGELVEIQSEMVDVVNVDAEREEQLATMTPNALVRLAVERDLDIDRLGKLMEMQMRWEQENARKAFFAALSHFQSQLPPILKVDKVDAGKAGRRRFASLGTINEAIRPYLYCNGLSFRFQQNQPPEGITVTCIVSHRDGHSEQTSLTARADVSGGKNAIQSIGSSVTYLERYTLVSALGLTTVDSDDDGDEPEPPSPAEMMDLMKAAAAEQAAAMGQEAPPQDPETTTTLLRPGVTMRMPKSYSAKTTEPAVYEERVKKPSSADLAIEIKSLLKELDATLEDTQAILARRGVDKFDQIPLADAKELAKNLCGKVAEKNVCDRMMPENPQ